MAAPWPYNSFIILWCQVLFLLPVALLCITVGAVNLLPLSPKDLLNRLADSALPILSLTLSWIVNGWWTTDGETDKQRSVWEKNTRGQRTQRDDTCRCETFKVTRRSAEEAKNDKNTQTFVTEPVYFFFCKIQILAHFWVRVHDLTDSRGALCFSSEKHCLQVATKASLCR